MVLLQVDAPSVALNPFERDAPRSADMNTVAFRFPAQSMKVKSRYVDCDELFGLIKNIQPSEATGMEISADSGASSFQK